MARKASNGKRKRWKAKCWAVLLVAEWLVNLPNTDHCRHVWALQTPITHTVVHHPSIRVSDSSDSESRLCGTAPDSMAHILSACPALAQTKYLARHDAILKVLFFKIICDLGLLDTVPLVVFTYQATVSLWNSRGTGILGCSSIWGVPRAQSK